MTTIEQQHTFIELRAKGYSFSKIAVELKVSKPTLIKWSEDLKDNIDNYRELEMEALREEYSMTKRHATILLGEQLGKIRTELKKRDFSEVPTHKLVELCIKLTDEISGDDTVQLKAEGLQRLQHAYKWKV